MRGVYAFFLVFYLKNPKNLQKTNKKPIISWNPWSSVRKYGFFWFFMCFYSFYWFFIGFFWFFEVFLRFWLEKPKKPSVFLVFGRLWEALDFTSVRRELSGLYFCSSGALWTLLLFVGVSPDSTSVRQELSGLYFCSSGPPLGGSGSLWEALGASGSFWEALWVSGMLWEAPAGQAQIPLISY